MTKQPPRPHPPEKVKDGVCLACYRFAVIRAGLATRCAAYTIEAGYPEGPEKKGA